MKHLQDFPAKVWQETCHRLLRNSILRLQYKESLSIDFIDGKVEDLDRELVAGMGLQAFDAAGKSVLVTEDSLDPSACPRLIEEALTLLESTSPSLEDPSTALEALSPRHQSIERAALPLDEEELLNQAKAFHEPLLHPDFKIHTALTQVEEMWRIFRKDGSDLWFNVPRISVYHLFTYHHAKKTIRWMDAHCGDRFDSIFQRHHYPFLKRSRDRLKDLLDAPPYQDHFDFLLIDAGLAKGLAHEAFGHSSESDLVREGSVLSENHRYKVGLEVAPSFVHILDKSLEGDWAYAPIGMNGETRQEVYLVRHGKLNHALADVHTAQAIGVPVQGSARLESYAHPPLPRMSNIHFKLTETQPALPDPEEPRAVWERLLQSGWVQKKDRVLQLMGYRGGQVNTLVGEYVFQCQGMYHHTQEGSVLYRGGQWSGGVLDTLKNIVGGFGELSLFRQGTCGKSGQGVPSSGGGPQLLLFRAGSGFRVSSR